MCIKSKLRGNMSRSELYMIIPCGYCGKQIVLLQVWFYFSLDYILSQDVSLSVSTIIIALCFCFRLI